jgi:hypothetical protein
MNKIIIIADWLIDFITKEPYMFAKKLQTDYDWTIIKLSMLNVEQVKQKKSIVLCITYDSLDISVLKCENITLIYKIDDLHNSNVKRSHNMTYADIIISPYQYMFISNWVISMYPMVKIKQSIHVPYSAINTFYETIEFNNNPIEKIFISGANQKNIYPLRNFINTDILCKDYIDYLEHPTYKQYTHDIIDEKYYKKLNTYLCCFTDASIYKYVLLKVFEICSVGSLLLVDDTICTNLEDIGFYNNVNCIMCNKDDLHNKIKWIIEPKNRQEVNTIRMNGMKLVREKHNVYTRSNEFNYAIKNICKL